MLLVARRMVVVNVKYKTERKKREENDWNETVDDSGLVSARDGHKLDGRPRHSEARPVMGPFVEPH